ncbi:MAG: 3-dehydroquinate synthase [Candidatus Omnitrophica bacterium]|nr:3-dehydroquinate synthase [Candidatus Omnitrophota bacterium]
MKKIRVSLLENSYNILIGRNLINKIHNFLKNLELGNPPIIITNPKINIVIGKNLKKTLLNSGYKEIGSFIMADSERSKSLEVTVKAINFLTKLEKFNNPFIIALGGGVVGDLAGFVASIYKRGIPYVNIPTTLLSQVDSSIGGKVGVDLKAGKNLIGSFYQPKLVLIDISLLETLSSRHIKSGIAEIIKYGVICDYGLFGYLEENFKEILKLKPVHIEKIVYESVRIKSRVVEKDEREERGFRTILNFGHTVGHALEAATEYSGIYSHGEAISFGMICATDISERLGICKGILKERLELLLKKYNLPTFIKNIRIDKMIKSICMDKKFIHGKTRLVLPVKIGKVEIVEGVPLKLIEEAIKNRSY